MSTHPTNPYPEVKFLRAPGWPELELRYSRYRTKVFEKHTHETYSIGLVQSGRTRLFRLEASPGEWVERGDLALINPGQVHACNPEGVHPLDYVMLYVNPGLLQKIAAATGDDCPSFRFRASIVRDPPLAEGFAGLCTALSEAISALEIESCLYETLSGLILAYGCSPRPAETVPVATQVSRGREYLLDHLARNVSLDEVAAVCGLSPFHFLRAFRIRYGLPPHTYQLQARIHFAKRRLVEGVSIAQVAVEAGFADQSHFNRKFKALVGATPRQYQAAIPAPSAAAPGSRSSG